MNKIRLYNNYIKDMNLDNNVEIEKVRKTDLFTVNQIKLKVVKDTNLFIEFTGDKETKLDIYIEVLANVKCIITEEKSNSNFKIRYTYTLNNNSLLDLKKYYFNNDIRELNNIHLKDSSKLNYYISTISKQRERYDLILYQSNSKSTAKIDIKALNLESTFNFNIDKFDEGLENLLDIDSHIFTSKLELCKLNTNLDNNYISNVTLLDEKNNYLKEFNDNKFIEEV